MGNLFTTIISFFYSLFSKLKISKKMLLLVLTLVAFILYFIGTDPDAKLITDLAYGQELVLIISIFIIAAFAITFQETFTDIYTGDGKESDDEDKELINIAKQTPEGASSVLIAKSIKLSVRLLSYSIIIAAAIFSVNGIL